MSQPLIGILDCDCGNLRSVSKALGKVGARGEVSKRVNPDWSGLILPGVGAFGHAVGSMAGTKGHVKAYVANRKPFLGICLGLQVLFESSEESPGVDGLGLMHGRVTRIEGRKVPHMGWNSLDIRRSSAILRGIRSGDYFYFVHSYAAAPEEDSLVASCQYGTGDLTAVVERDNIFACQFHPEKSGALGLRVLKNFIEICRGGS